MAVDQVAARQWLTLLHGDAPGLIHICATGLWQGWTFTPDNLDGALDYITSLDASGREGIYARITTLRPRPGMAPVGRGSAADSLALPALWADVDIAGPGHKDANLPPTEAEARAIVAASGLPAPSRWVHSGGGLYPIWLLDTPHVIDGDLADLADLSAHWQAAIGHAAAECGYHYGTGVGDLARVLRIPGSVNRKEGLERPCRLLDDEGPRYTLAELYRAGVDAVGASPTARELERYPDPVARRQPQPAAPGECSPGDDFAQRTDWAEILEPHGWRYAYTCGAVRYWRRPGKGDHDGISATTNALGTDRLHVFSTSTAFDTRSYSKLAAYAVLEHGGDMSAAARELAAKGFGSRPDPARAQAAILAEIIGTPVAGHPAHAGTPAPATIDEADAEGVAAVQYSTAVAAEVRRLRINRDARRQVDGEKWRTPVWRHTLSADLDAVPPAPVRYRIHGLLTEGGNAVLTAMFKAGKTTLCNNLLRSLVDGVPFLGRFAATIPKGRVAAWNYEVHEGQYIQWLRDTGIVNTDAITVLNLRGFSMPLAQPQIVDWVVDWLRAYDIKVWIVDPFARAMIGSGEENSNTDVGVFLDTLDVIKSRAGVSELIVPTHTGRAEQDIGAERARGAARIDDWPDQRWIMTVDDAGRRFFRATGRDVDVPEERLEFDPITRHLTLGGTDRNGTRRHDLLAEVIAYVATNPGAGINDVALGLGRGKERVVHALAEAVANRLLLVYEGTNRKRLHYPLGHVARPEVTE